MTRSDGRAAEASGGAASGGRAVAGVVPASGASRRMGRPKGLLEIGDATFAQRVVRALVQGGCAPVYAVADARDDVLIAHLRGTGARVLENPDPGEGPITSLRLALRRLPESADAVVYLPLDHALVEPGHVSALIEAAHRAGADLAVPVHGGKRGHPAYFGRRLFEELSDPDLRGGARTVVHRHLDRACLLACDDRAVIMDIDTPEAYREALRVFDAEGSGEVSAPGPLEGTDEEPASRLGGDGPA